VVLGSVTLAGCTVPTPPEPFAEVPTCSDGKFAFEIVTYYPFEERQQAVHDHEQGDTIKPIRRISEP
jgi:hypothetical protein